MRRLCSESSRPYRGRSARRAIPRVRDGAPLSNGRSDRAEVSRSHSRRGNGRVWHVRGKRAPKEGRTHPAEGRNLRGGTELSLSPQRRSRSAELAGGDPDRERHQRTVGFADEGTVFLAASQAWPLSGTAVCGPARTVVWGPGANNPRLPDWVL